MIARAATSPEWTRDPTRFLRIVATITTCALLPLVVVGTGVTTKHAGMAFPDWPTSNGSILNPESWTQNEKTLFEHGHRLLGWTVGLLAITQVWAAFKHDRGLRLAAVATLLAIIIQGVLGGVRVKLDSTPLAMVHGIWAQICFALSCTVLLQASRSWAESSVIQARGVTFFRKLCVSGMIVILLQLGFGAAYRHLGSKHALIAHLIGAVVVICILGWISMWTLEQYPNSPLLLRLGRWMTALIGTQLVLGGFSFLVATMGTDLGTTMRWIVPACHVAVGALLLGCMTCIYLSTTRVLLPLNPTERLNRAAAEVSA